jgi:hypothetical protein
VALSAETLTIKAAEEEKQLAVRELLSVSRAGIAPDSHQRAAVWVELVDGSELLAERYTASQSTATITLLGGVEVQAPTRAIRFVRLRPPDAALQKQWTEIVEAKASSDTLVIRKTSTVKVEGEDKERAQLALDSLEGVIKGVTPEAVQFVFDGDALDVRREKIEGLLYYHAVDRELPEAACRVTDVSGSRWLARTVSVTGEELEIATPSGVKAKLPLARFSQLDYSAGNTVFLAELKPDAAEFRHPLDDRFSSSRLAKLYQPRDGRGVESGSTLRLGGENHERGLALQTRTQLVYRLPAKSRWFQALAGLDDSVSDQCQARLVISGDNKTLFSEVISGADEPRPIKLDVSGVRRLTILVDVVSDRISSQLDLAEVRITK